LLSDRQTLISYLPLSHMMEQMCHWFFLLTGNRIGYFRGNVTGLPDDMKTLKPTVFPVVPRLLNRLYDTIQNGIARAGPVKKWLFNKAYQAKLADLHRGVVRNDTFWDKIVFSKLQNELGGQVRFMVTGSAPISAEVLETCRATLGATILEGYGQTETTALATGTWPGDCTGGHVGGPASCSLIKLADVEELQCYAKDKKGEICVKGPSITKGYYKDPAKTAELIDEDGWLHTGDVGQILPNGTIKIIDRKKHIFKLAQGEYVAPEKIENVYVRAPTVAQVYVDGNSLERHLVAVVVPNEKELIKWYKEHVHNNGTSLEDICKSKQARDYILAELNKIGKENKLNSIEQVKAVHLSPEQFTVENDLLTPTLKAKRPQLRRHFAATIDKLYEESN
jgi:long-chain acyl-CoA synthetase